MFVAYLHKNMEQDQWEVAKVAPYNDYYTRMRDASAIGYKQFYIEALDELDAYIKTKAFCGEAF